MKRFLLIVGLVVCISGFDKNELFAQSYMSAGLELGRLGGYYEFQWRAGKRITLGPRLSLVRGPYVFSDRALYIAAVFKGDYHWSTHISALPEELDLYGGISMGIAHQEYSGPNSNFEIKEQVNRFLLTVQAGGRWYFSNRFAAHLELRAGPNNWNGFGSAGITLKLGNAND